jgi:hypothetical protein
MRRLSIIIALVTAAAAGAATSSAAILHFTGRAGAELRPAPKAVRVHAHAAPAAHQKRHAAATPTAAKFARLLAGSSNKYGREHSAPERIRRVDRVQASTGQYMCSYAVVRTGAANECHLIQARWTPNASSTYTVTLSGRTARCHTLRDAINSLG